MKKLAIVGSGLIGRSWAIVFARAGWSVALFDPVAGIAERAGPLIEAELKSLARFGLVADPAAALARIQAVRTLEEALAGAELVQESGPEDVQAKIDIYAQLDRHADPGTVLASSTSAIVASLFTEKLAGRARCLVAHPVNPPHLVPIVELCGAPWTSADVVAQARAIYESVGQVPITVRREIEGFVLNRLQGALLAEAFRLVGEGYVSPQDLDHTIKDGLGLRWSFMGPFETIELNAPGGIPDYCARYTGFYKRLQAAPAAPQSYGEANVAQIVREWNQAATPERIARRMQWRDERLAALAAHKKTQPPS
ncbi:MAG: 3-hydroxyacyl-CoA dehydrogenase [Pseudorhodoplanes sp.]